MSTANERLEQRLRELPSDVLAELLLKLTKGNPALKRHLVAITSDTKDLISAVKKGISGIRRSTKFYPYHDAHKFHTKLNTLVAHIESIGKANPKVAFELLCELHALEVFVEDSVDDGVGFVDQIFKVDLPRIAASITSRHNDEAHLKKWLLVALEEDPFDSGCDLVDAIASTVSESVLRDLVETISTTVALQPREPLFENRQLAYVQRRLLVALGDTEAFIECCTYEGGIVEPDIETIIQMYKDHEQHDLAQPWIDILEQSRSAERERYAAQAQENLRRMAEQEALWKANYVAPDYRGRFLSKPTEQTFKALRKNLPAKEVESIIDEFAKEVEVAPQHSIHSLRVLITAGRGAIAESIVMARNTTNDAPSRTWHSLVEMFESSGHFLGATISCRVILDRILESSTVGQSYTASDMYAKLWELAPLVTDWRDVTTHADYYADLCNRYFDYRKFWMTVEYSSRPPKESRFSGRKVW